MSRPPGENASRTHSAGRELAREWALAVVGAMEPRLVFRLKNLLTYNFVAGLDMSAAATLDVPYERRHEVWAAGARAAGLRRSSPLLYLEFGVFKGDSMAWWSEFNQVESSRFFGFDTFEGLPEEWIAARAAEGTFDAGGQVPLSRDDRVHFIKGLFHETLPAFFVDTDVAGSDATVVVHFDADLYSSTVVAMAHLCARLLPGRTMLWFFDEFYPEEARALEGFQRAFGLKLRGLATNRSGSKVCLEVRG
jgi:hypothetical protein